MAGTATGTTIGLVSTDAEVVNAIRRQLVTVGRALHVVASLEEMARRQVELGLDVLLIQTDAPGEVRKRLAEGVRFSSPPQVIAMARERTIQEAVHCVRAGALDYLCAWPLDEQSLDHALSRALHKMAEAAAGREEDLRSPLAGFITADQQTLTVCRIAAGAADDKTPMLIEGESGTGKSLLAQLIHEHSCRRMGPFIEVNCGALTEPLLERELFGVAPARTAANETEVFGQISAANGGTLLLDEIGSASGAIQVKILRVIETGDFIRVGEETAFHSDVRIIGAAAGSLEQKVHQGLFREDLFRKLGTLRVALPPLRDRVMDVPLLARHMLNQLAAQYHRQVEEFAPEVFDSLVHYAWPGNVRELRNVIEYAVILAVGGLVRAEDLPPYVLSPSGNGMRAPASETVDARPLREALREPERQAILWALRQSGWNKQHAAVRLSISRSTLYKKMKDYGLTGPGDETALALH